ncbi:hypothetical protein [Pseudomonas sp. SWRI99]|uniref:hypothetical protein n=1 Tax=Pseudomonas sp. SWRI99 TaxID=2745506 RepID=UPI00164614A2|nr:hypothetical protein [Pseudomonas sp. SWRI99]MBC3777649.1 hypothetical protein [Pseudomonas sp. SWRI99]
MPYNPFQIDDLDNKTPKDRLAEDKNCVAMSFSKVLGINAHAAINFFLQKGWIESARKLENDTIVESIADHLRMKKIYSDKPWGELKTLMAKDLDGRYLAVNTGINGFNESPSSVGHAFCIIKNGGLGVAGNNAENPNSPYHSRIGQTHKITVWGPVRWCPYFGIPEPAKK